MADVDGSGVGGGEPSPAYGAAAGGAAPDAAAVQAQGMRQRRAAQDAAVEEHKGKNLDEMRAELAKKRALVADMRKWNNRLNVVLMIVIVPFSALVLFSLFKTQLIEWCHAGPPVFFPRMFPEACTWLRGYFPEAFQQLAEVAEAAAKAAKEAAAAAAGSGSGDA